MIYKVLETGEILNSAKECVEYERKQLELLSNKILSYHWCGTNTIDWEHPDKWTTKEPHFGYVLRFIETLTNIQANIFMKLLRKDGDTERYNINENYTLVKGSVLMFINKEEEDGITYGYTELEPAIARRLFPED